MDQKVTPHVSNGAPDKVYQVVFRPHFAGTPDRALEKTLSFSCRICGGFICVSKMREV